VLLVIVVIELNVIVGSGPGAVPLNLRAQLIGGALALPILFRHRWPFQVMITTAVLIFLYYIFARRNISPAPLFFVPLYDAAVAGYLIWAVAIAAGFMITGLFVVELSTREGLATLASDFLSQIVILALAVTLGEVVRGRRALTAETATRLRLAEEERAAEAGRLVAEERLHIARELHDTVAHSMATITVQAASALHLLGPDGTTMGPNDPASSSPRPHRGHRADADLLRAALTAIRETSKGALAEMSSVLGQLRRSGRREPGGPDDAPGTGSAADAATGLSRLGALRDAVTAAGAAVTVTIEGEQWPLSAQADHSAYRILQESLTNVLRHAGPGAAAQVCLHYQPEALTLTVTDNGSGPAPGPHEAGAIADAASGDAS
jgi:signal transduction histidine kinase